MAFDGIVIANLVHELNETVLNTRISKIAQPETDELLFTLKGKDGQKRLLLSASASLPLIYLTENNKPSPMTAPNFCMLLRKHIANGRITKIWQPDMERIINFEIEHLNELGDLCRKTLIVEVMGKHSNIIFCDDTGRIIDSIKHIPAQVSSVREVLPGRDYFIPKTQEKYNPLHTDQDFFCSHVLGRPMSISKAIYSTYTGISPIIANEICHRASLDGDLPTDALNEDTALHLYHNFSWMMQDVTECSFAPNIVMNGKEPIEFSSFHLSVYDKDTCEDYPSISAVLEQYYAKKNEYTRIRQKSVDLRKIVSNTLERERKKYDLQRKQLKDTEKREKYKVYGELLTTYGYQAKEGDKSLEALNYYTNEMIKIPLDETLTPLENAKKYFNKYAKLKRTYQALTELITETETEIAHLESIATSLDIATQEDDLAEIREELIAYGYIHKKSGEKKKKSKSKPLHYVSSDGYHMYVGKNNYQNDALTFKFAVGNDWWFHAKGMPGSHVIVKTNGDELPDATYEEAAKLAAYYSKGRENPKVEIDYLEKKNVKKPSGAAPGFVIYYTNYSMPIEPDITGITQIE